MRLRELSIIQYQNVSNSAVLPRLWLPLSAFQKQISFFASNDLIILSMDDAMEYMKRRKYLKKGRPICLTFDNGFRDIYNDVFPLLKDYGFPFTVLISPMKVGKEIKNSERNIHYLTWNDLQELVRYDVTIGAYDDYAWNVNDIPEDVIINHIKDYKKILEHKLGIGINYFGVKEGVPNNRIRDLLISEGYRAFLTECPTNKKPDLFSIGRIQVDDDDFNIFLTKISRTYLFFKDKKSWKYIRAYSIDKLAHRFSETFDRLRSVK